MAQFNLSSRLGRLKTYLHYLWNDHAYLRLGFQNAHWISPEMARSNQPWPYQLKAWRCAGVKTILNLRGSGHAAGFYDLEKDACERLGLERPDPRAQAKGVGDCGRLPSGNCTTSNHLHNNMRLLLGSCSEATHLLFRGYASARSSVVQRTGIALAGTRKSPPDRPRVLS